MFTRIDKYIIRKYLGTFFLSIVLIISVSVVFDLTEKLDTFHTHKAPLSAIVFDYYFNFIPFFANLFTPLFAFISVIFFTSKLAYNTEIIAMLSGGVSFNRLLRPYFMAATLIGLLSFALSGYVIPPSNKVRLDFEDKYVQKFKTELAMNVQLEVEPGIIAYIERFESSRNRGYHFSLEEFRNKTLVSRMTAQYIVFDSLNQWHVTDYLIRDFDGMYETIRRGERLDTVIQMDPSDFFISGKQAPQMTNPELSRYLTKQQMRGVGGVQAFEDEYHKRFSMPFAAIILTLIGVSLSSRKVRGGTGLHIGVGIGLSAVYILFSTVSSTFAINGSMPTLLAVWLPNIIFSIIGLALYVKAPK
ncbi:MAG: LptF/LptG family permease [Prevotellaceae bacterium]|jgi:lipopolysaccharide export system permease protein|nr:LptF/LptG family permease [Prevotellaceae bacterium]